MSSSVVTSEAPSVVIDPVATPSASLSGSMAIGRRVDYLDNLRALAMLLGVYLHAALAYANPAQTIWLATDTQSRVWIDISIWWIHLFRMGLFFLLAGYFAKLVYQRRGLARFIGGRLLRIVGPFVLFYPLLLVAMTLIIVFSLSYQENPRGLMGLIADASKGVSRDSAEPPGTMHLWFLYYLMWFTLISVAIAWLNRAAHWTPKFHPLWLTVLPIALVPSLVVAGNPLPAPESFIPTWWPVVFYGSFYWVGWWLWSREFFLDRLNRFRWPLLVAGVPLFGAYYSVLPPVDLSAITAAGVVPSEGISLNTWVVSILGAYLSALWVGIALVFGKRWLNYHSGMLRLVADSSYWVYLVHLPIVIFLQTLLIPLAWPAEVKLMLTVLGTILPCWASYLVFVRYTPLGWMLHGKRSFP
jgi:surface polysaccharide O-acyltransferase-like enzyme